MRVRPLNQRQIKRDSPKFHHPGILKLGIISLVNAKKNLSHSFIYTISLIGLFDGEMSQNFRDLY